MYIISSDYYHWIESVLFLSSLTFASLAIFFLISHLSDKKSNTSINLALIGTALIVESGFQYALYHNWLITFVYHSNEYHTLGTPFNYSICLLKWPIVFTLLLTSWLLSSTMSCRYRLFIFILGAFALAPLWLPLSLYITASLTAILLLALHILGWLYLKPNQSNVCGVGSWCWLTTSTLILPATLIYLELYPVLELFLPLVYVMVSTAIIIPYIVLSYLSVHCNAD